MSRIDDLDRVLDSVCTFSMNLAFIPTVDLSQNIGIEIDELTEYLEELGNRGYIDNSSNGSYITLQGRMALENAKNGKPFKEELENKKLKKKWEITKIIAGVLNAVTIIAIAIWAQSSSNKNNELEEQIKSLKANQEIDNKEKQSQIDSLNNIIIKFNNKVSLDTIKVIKSKK
jgi:Mn-dependent DtxR family transcriptional regulator